VNDDAPVDFLTSAETLAPLPAETDVLVIGGGIVGTALAYYLASAGVETLVVDRGELNREASGTNAGSFHFQIALHQLTADETEADRARLLEEVRLHIEAADMWSQLEKDLSADLGVHQTGGLMVAETAEELQLLFDKQVIEQEAGLETHVLVGRELQEFAPYLATDLTGATYCPREGHANPFTAVPYLALRSHERGAAIRTQAGVRRLMVNEDGSAHRFTVETDRGTVRAHRVVNAAGAWANDLSTQVGLRLPIHAEGLHVNVTEPREHVLTPMVQHIGRRLTLKQSANNTFIIGGGWPARPERAPTRYSNYWASAAGNSAVAVRVMPMLADVRLVRTWTGVMAFMDDLSPIVGESSQVPGYHVCIANTGFTLGPMMAGLLAEAMVSGNSSGISPDYSPDRVVVLAK
jgi:sarcosine oxidase, subunit beta